MASLWRWLRGEDIWPNQWSTVTVQELRDLGGYYHREIICIDNQLFRVWWSDLRRDEVTIAPNHAVR